MKRRAIYELSLERFLDVLNGHIAIDLPEGAEIRNVNVDHMRARVELLCQGDCFEEVPENLVPPTLFDLRIKVLV